MKQTTLFFALLFTCIGFGQSPEITNYNWRCVGLDIDGESIQAPFNNSEVDKVTLSMLQDDDPSTEDFVTIVCNALTSSDGEVIYDDTQITFTLPELIQTLITCDQGGNQDFEGAYFYLFYDSQGSPLSYEIIELTEYVMTITSPNGDTAHYQEDSLGFSNSPIHTITMYPNPASSQVIIEANTDTIDRIEFYSIKGQVLKVLDNPSTSIDVSTLPQGNYFLKIYIGDSFSFKQFMKQ